MSVRYLVAMAGALALGFAASAANAATISMAFVADGASGTPVLTANLTLDVVGNQAIGGTGTLTSPYWTGYETLSLVTLNTSNVHNLGGGNLSFRFGGGTDLIGDTLFPISGNGLVFSVNTPDQPGRDVGFNLWSTGGNTYYGFIAANDIYAGYGGTGTVSSVPLPAALPLFGAALAGLGGLGWLGARKSNA